MFLPEDIDEVTIHYKRVHEDGGCICTMLCVASRLSVRRRQRWAGVFGTTMQGGGFVYGNGLFLRGRSDDLNSLVPLVAKLVACEQSYFS